MDVQVLAQSDTDMPLSTVLVLFAFSVLVLVLFIGVMLFRESHKKKKAGRAFADTHGQRAGALVGEIDRLIRGIRSPLMPPTAQAEWELAKQEFARDPQSATVIEKIYATYENARYVAGIEGGDVRCRRQAVNELMTEARTVNAHPVFRDIAALRGREAESTFIEEFVRVVHSVGQFSKRCFGDVPVTVTSREFRPAAGMGGYVPAGAVWNRTAKYEAKRLADPDDLLRPCTEAQIYRRWREGVAR
ncbi:hypothetical protein [Corynebacterium sp. p3-SID1194]|uniref:hypothetical protein n=1 Tax=Corynebacterium sp. p3-SID1194 TaxID=2916105 RepID=UPI0021A622EC|nr:hypothetical protein [Corynebacterium sp. p3-SID1194]MCT1450150.1 hypothetical protein [Corynebacterium sp. p3-SID1194]